jgi:hypothetical protein
MVIIGDFASNALKLVFLLRLLRLARVIMIMQVIAVLQDNFAAPAMAVPLRIRMQASLQCVHLHDRLLPWHGA